MAEQNAKENMNASARDFFGLMVHMVWTLGLIAKIVLRRDASAGNNV